MLKVINRIFEELKKNQVHVLYYVKLIVTIFNTMCLNFRFFVLVTVYLISGVLFMKYKRNESGIGLLPNRNFWVDLPALIKVRSD